MPKALDPGLMEALQKFHPNPKAAVWDCHGTWVVYHKDVELMAVRAGITFDPPQVIEANGQAKCAAVCVRAQTADGVADWSIGEASPSNNKNAYPYAMAEKRARDRVVLKLLGLHGSVYSEDEADDFKPPESLALTVAEIERVFIFALCMARNTDDLTEWAIENKSAIEKMPEASAAAIRKAYANHRTKLAESEYQKEAAE
jgi:hypothetical protein